MRRTLKTLALPAVALGLAAGLLAAAHTGLLAGPATPDLPPAAAAARPASDAPAGVTDWRETSTRGTPSGTQTSPGIPPTPAPSASRPDPAAARLLGLVLLTAVQLVPLPELAVRAVSPTRAEWHRTLRPAADEVLPGEPAPGPPRPAWLPLSIDPAATREFLVRVAAVFLAYAAARNLVASPAAFRRLAWVGFALAGVPFSLWRGGLLAVLAAGGVTLLVRRLAAGPDRRPAAGRGAVVGLVLVAVGLGTWFGWEPVVRRLGTLQNRAA